MRASARHAADQPVTAEETTARAGDPTVSRRWFTDRIEAQAALDERRRIPAATPSPTKPGTRSMSVAGSGVALMLALTEVGFGLSPVVGAWMLMFPVLSRTKRYVTGPIVVVWT